MKNILFLSILLIDFLYADMVGIKSKMWTGVPTEIYNDTKTVAMLEDATNNSEISTQSEWITSSDTPSDDIEKSAQEVASLPLATFEQPVTNIAPEQTFSDDTQMITSVDTDELPLATLASNSISNEVINEPLATFDTPAEDVVSNDSQKSITEQEVEAIINKAHASDETSVVQEPTLVEPSMVDPIESTTVDSKTVSEVTDKSSPMMKTISDYLDSFISYIKENILLASYSLALFFAFLYLFIAKPWSSSNSDMVNVNELNNYEDDFEIPQLKQQAISKIEKKALPKEPQVSMQDKSLLTQNQYSTLYGLINETFIYEKEKILLSDDKTQDRKNRETISLEWKFNQILHFSLPKLATDNSRQFVQGVKELIVNDHTRDIMRVALKDILENRSITEVERASINKELAYYEDRKQQQYEAQKERVISNSY